MRQSIFQEKRLKKDIEYSYIRYRTQSYVLEELARLGPVTEEEFKYYMLINMDQSLSCIAGLFDLTQAIKVLTRLGYLTVINDKISLTEDGIEALKACTFQNLSNTAFFNYINYRNQRLCYIISALALLVSIISLIVSMN